MSQLYAYLLEGANVLLQWSFTLTGNYGLAIILFTFLIQVVTYPLKHPQLRYSKINVIIAPQIKEINTKYKGNQEKISQETLALWKKYNVNPMAGCLPSLVQLPIFFAILAVMRNFEFPVGPESAFLWIKNIGEIDNLRILPVLSGVSTYFQLSLSGAAKDPSQKSMLYMFPGLMFWITLSAPAGLALYWAMQNVFGIGQQYLINRFVSVPELVTEEETSDHKKKGAPAKDENS